MALSVCLLLDHRGEHAVRALWSRLEAHGVPSLATHTHGRHHPHLSYAVLLRWDLQAVQDALALLPDGGPFPVTFQGMVAFPGARLPRAVVARGGGGAPGGGVHGARAAGAAGAPPLRARTVGAALLAVAARQRWRAARGGPGRQRRAAADGPRDRVALVDSSTGQT